MTRLFLGLTLPPGLAQEIQAVLSNEYPFVTKIVPARWWYLMMVIMGESDVSDAQRNQLLQPLPQLFAPTISLSHIGQDTFSGELWVYVKANAILTQLRQTLLKRLNALNIRWENEIEFVPHITLATLREKATAVNRPLQLTFMPTTINLYRRVRKDAAEEYRSEGSLTLVD